MGTRYSASLAACVRLAGAQHGVIGRLQARATGLSADAIQRLVQTDRWRRVHPSVYALWVPPEPEQRRRHVLMGAVLWLGGRAAVSGKAAALDWGLDGIDEARPELSTTGHRQTKSGLIIVHRVLRLDDDEIVLRGRLPVTAVPRTLVDLGRGVDASTLEVAAESALRRRLATRDQIARALERAGTTTPGRAVLATVIAQRRTTGSFLEVLAWQLIRDFGLPFPVRQFEVELPAGPRWIDLAYPAERIAIELDGFESHSSKRDVERDRLRQNALVRQGWTVYRATKRDLVHRRTQVALDIKGLLAQRRSRFAAG